ncbi:MAG: UDP-N-acetylglucosamine 2-epimerase (non-hydrolyzing) [Flavobacteriales bacterium]|nr:UDP-N-acetylglucosamine 2-epimerase (non-hydrolyzing) [Flavobacteriales bacterium]
MAKVNVISVVGARPQFVKAAAIDRAMSRSGTMVHSVLHTGQHYDERMSAVFFKELGIPEPQWDLGVGSGTHGHQTASMLSAIEKVLVEAKPDVVLLYGDTNSTLAAAMATAKLRIPMAHIEAGLRSFNKSMPEEINRIMCDHCSTWLFCPTMVAVDNLRREGFEPKSKGRATMDSPHVIMSGDVMYDNSSYFSAVAAERSVILKTHGLVAERFVLATIHRENNTDDADRLKAIITGLAEVASAHDLPVVLPLHPRTQDRLDRSPELATAAKDLVLIPPVGYLDMIALERNARLVITDSGGVQKEAFFFNKPCVVLRAETEWVELVQRGQAVLADADPKRIHEAVAGFMKHGKPTCEDLYGDGHAAERIIKELEDAFT